MSRNRGRRSRNPNGFNKPAVQKQIENIIRVVGDEWAKEDVYRLLQDTSFNTELVVDKIINGEAKPNPDSWHTVANKTKTKPQRGGSHGRGRGRRDHSRGGGRFRGAPRGYVKKDGPPGGRRLTPEERARLGLDAPPPRNGVHTPVGNGVKSHTEPASSRPAPVKTKEEKKEDTPPLGDGLLPTPTTTVDEPLPHVTPSSGQASAGGARTNPKLTARNEEAEKIPSSAMNDSRSNPRFSNPASKHRVWKPKTVPADEVESKPAEPVTSDTREPRLPVPVPVEERRPEPEPVRTDSGHSGHEPVADILPSGLGTADELASVRLQFGNFGISSSPSPATPATSGSIGGGDMRAARRVDTAGNKENERRLEKETRANVRPTKTENGTPGAGPAVGRGKREESASGHAHPPGGGSYELAESAQYLRDPAAMAGFPPYVSPYMAPYGQYGFDDPAAGAHGVHPHSMFPYGDPSHGYPSPAGYRGAASPPFQREPHADGSRKYPADGQEDSTAPKSRSDASTGTSDSRAAGPGGPGGPAGPDGKSSPIPHSPHGYPGYGMGAGPMHPYYPYPLGGGFAPYGPPSGSASNPAYSRYPYQQHPYYPPKYGMSSGYGPGAPHSGPYDDSSSGSAGGAGGSGGEYPMSGNSSFWPENESKSSEGAPSGGASAGPPNGGRGSGPAYPSHDRLAPYGDDAPPMDPTAYSYLPGYGAPPSVPFGSYGAPPSAPPTSSGPGQYS